MTIKVCLVHQIQAYFKPWEVGLRLCVTFPHARVCVCLCTVWQVKTRPLVCFPEVIPSELTFAELDNILFTLFLAFTGKC